METDVLEEFHGEFDWAEAFRQNPDEPPCCDFHAKRAGYPYASTSGTELRLAARTTGEEEG